MGSDWLTIGRARTTADLRGPAPGPKRAHLVKQLVKQASLTRHNQNSPRPAFPHVRGCFVLVGDTGFEPVTSSVSTTFTPSLAVRRVRLSTNHSPAVPRCPPESAPVVTHLVTHSPADLDARRGPTEHSDRPRVRRVTMAQRARHCAREVSGNIHSHADERALPYTPKFKESGSSPA